MLPEDPLEEDLLGIKMEFKAEPTEVPEEPASPESQEALNAPGPSASTAGKSVSQIVASTRLNVLDSTNTAKASSG